MVALLACGRSSVPHVLYNALFVKKNAERENVKDVYIQFNGFLNLSILTLIFQFVLNKCYNSQTKTRCKFVHSNTHCHSIKQL